MNEFLIAAGTCVLTGIFTTINPCPLTTTVAAIGFLTSYGKRTERILMVILFFVLGYLSAYLILAIVLSSGIIAVQGLSEVLQKYFSALIGPIFIIAGMIQLELISIKIPRFNSKAVSFFTRTKWSGMQALPMGFLIALGFCPATAAIFFGILIPLAINYEQPVLFPLLYALGAALPLTAISLFVLASGRQAGKERKWQKILPLLGGWLLIFAGIYLTIRRIWL